MSDIKWIKITVNMFDDEKIKLIESMPESDTILVIWIKLLIQAGRNNHNGFIFLNENIPYTDEMLSTVFDRPVSVVRLALKTLQDFDMIEFDENDFLRISNWEKHQNVDGMERVRELNRKRNQRYRKRKKQKLLEQKKDNDVSVTSHDGTEEELELELELEEDKEQQQKQAKSNVVNPFTFYEQNYGLLNPFIAGNISQWIDDLNNELVTESMKLALKQNKPFKYAEAIMKIWKDKNIKTIDDVRADEVAFQKSLESKNKKQPKTREDIKNEIGRSSYK